MPVLPLARIATSACNRHLHLHGLLEANAPVPWINYMEIWIMELEFNSVANLQEMFGEQQLMPLTIQPSKHVRITYTVIALRWQLLSLTSFIHACKILSAKYPVSNVQ